MPVKVSEIISRCDTIKPNEYPQRQKKEWVMKIESDIRKYAVMYGEAKTGPADTNEENPELFLPDEFSEIYLYYLISMIDLANQEYQLYNNSAAFFNSAYLEWKKKHRRENIPDCKISVRV